MFDVLVNGTARNYPRPGGTPETRPAFLGQFASAHMLFENRTWFGIHGTRKRPFCPAYGPIGRRTRPVTIPLTLSAHCSAFPCPRTVFDYSCEHS